MSPKALESAFRRSLKRSAPKAVPIPLRIQIATMNEAFLRGQTVWPVNTTGKRIREINEAFLRGQTVWPANTTGKRIREINARFLHPTES